MNKKINFKIILFSTLLIALVVFLTFEFKVKDRTIHEYYKVYLSGKSLGLIENKDELYDLIDKEQTHIKEKYGVDKVYPPNGLEIQKVNTYRTNIKTAEYIYNEIKDLDPFTIEGYVVKVVDEDNNEEKTFYILHKEDLDEAVENTIHAFIDEEEYNAYLTGTQNTDSEEGTEIVNVYFNENVTIKKTYISTEEDILTDSTELSQYFLFGTRELTKKYTVQSTDTIETIAYNNELGVSDFLIANPDIVGENALLAVGQEVTVAPISPIANIVVETYETSYLDVDYETEVQYDKNLDAAETYVKQEGVKGVSKVTYATRYMNGVILQNQMVNEEVISEPVNKIVVYGANSITYVGNSTYWAWPTSKPYRISSYYGYRIHPIRGEEHFHAGIDITGTSSRNIYAIQSGTVTKAVKSGYNSGKGLFVNIEHNSTYTSTYWHLAKVLVEEGEHVEKGQLIGIMGMTGSATGVHLDFRIIKNGSNINPLILYR